jgi:mannose-6-phosphate isomerase class I
LTRPHSTYDRFPTVHISDSDADCHVGWEEICAALLPLSRVTVVEAYPGVDVDSIERTIVPLLKPELVIRSEEALLPAAILEDKFRSALGNDRVFACMQPWTLDSFFSTEKIASLRGLMYASAGPVLVIGTGATLIADDDSPIVYADLSRWEIQARQRAHQSGNLGADNRDASASEIYRRSFFIDWRAADRLKQSLLPKLDFLLDTHDADQPKMLPGEVFRDALRSTARRPFRVVPFFDPGPWGGHWMKERFELPDGPPNYAWCFDCVPEENSLRLRFGSCIVELPAIDVVFFSPECLLGKHVYERFGAEFPIRFDYLDTMGGGNLSLQVHPLTQYIREHFGMDYTQDESYYMLDAAPDATVFLGLKETADRAEMEADLRLAQADETAPFPAGKYVNAWPAKTHDHFLIPAGTIHCSGKNGVVLEISATPYIFTFKLWDWGRKGMDGKPRPIHLDHGLANIDWSRRANWVQENLINRFEPVDAGPGWHEERTGLHALEFIETRRHWFTEAVSHDTQGTVNVLNLVEGDVVIVESPTEAFPPLEIHYGETFIVPACVGRYTVRPARPVTQPLATIKAYVREVPAGA